MYLFIAVASRSAPPPNSCDIAPRTGTPTRVVVEADDAGNGFMRRSLRSLRKPVYSRHDFDVTVGHVLGCVAFAFGAFMPLLTLSLAVGG